MNKLFILISFLLLSFSAYADIFPGESNIGIQVIDTHEIDNNQLACEKKCDSDGQGTCSSGENQLCCFDDDACEACPWAFVDEVCSDH